MMPSSNASSLIEPSTYETQFEPHTDDEDNLWSVLEIVKEYRGKYLVKWEGFDPDTGKPWAPSWVPKYDCTDELIHDWKTKKAKKDQRRKKKRKSDGDLDYGSKISRNSTTGSKASSKSRSISLTVDPSSVAGPSKLQTSSPNSRIEAVVEIRRPKKRRRESQSSVQEFGTDVVDDEDKKLKKKRKTANADVQAASNSSPADAQINSSYKLPRSHDTRQQDPTEHTHSDASDRSSQYPRRQTATLSHKKRPPPPQSAVAAQLPRTQLRQDSSQVEFSPTRKTGGRLFQSAEGSDVERDNYDGNDELEDDDEPVQRTSVGQNLAEDPFHAIIREDGVGYDMDDNGIEVRITDYDLTLPGPDAGGVDPRSQSPPSPRDLFLGPGMIIPETQSSPQSKSHISTDGSTDTKTPSPSRKGKGNKGKPAKGSCNRDTYSKPTSKQKLGPVPVLSPSVFKRCVNEPPSIPPDSSIETFTTPSQTKLKSKSLAYSQRQEEEEEEEETLDAIEDYDDAPHDPSHPLVLVRKMRERSQLLGDPKPPRKSLDVISNSASSDINFEVLADEDAGRADSVLLGDELRPEDAPDARGHVGLSRPPEIPPSGDVNDSLEANAALTQQSNPMRLVIASPVRQLDNALGLLHRKSEEIHQYKMLLETCHSRTTELEAHVNSLKDRLKAAEGRHEESQAALDKERAVRVMVEEQPEEEKTTKNSPSSPLRHGDHVTQLLEENAQLRKVNAQLESDTDMFRKLYAQASEAHMTRLMDIKTLSRDNDSLREQAKNGVKQAGTFWATQVHTLEAQLSRSQGVVHVLTTQARRTDDDVRRRAALLPMVQREVEVTKDELEEWKEKVVELGRENTKLRIEVKEYEDEAMARRRKERARKDQETVAAEELIWMCPWMDAEHRTKCGALLESREKLREHFYEANHI